MGFHRVAHALAGRSAPPNGERMRSTRPAKREGVIHVRKLLAAALAICMFALWVLSVPPASADSEPDEMGMVLVSYSDMTFSLDVGHWEGTVKGDIRGTLELYESPANFVEGGLEYFFEDFIITTAKGVIQGTDARRLRPDDERLLGARSGHGGVRTLDVPGRLHAIRVGHHLTFRRVPDHRQPCAQRPFPGPSRVG